MNINNKTQTIVGLGLLTAIVVILQALSLSIPVGIFRITLVLVPIIVGAALSFSFRLPHFLLAFH